MDAFYCAGATKGLNRLARAPGPPFEPLNAKRLMPRRSLGLTRSCRLQKRAIQFGTRIANRHVYGKAKLRGDYHLSELVHPAAAGARVGLQGAGSTRDELSKRRRAAA